MNPNFVFRSGAHVGKTVEYVQQHHPTYIPWIRENRPEMLKGADKPEPKQIQPQAQKEVKKAPVKTMVPNDNFFNEGPDEMCKQYLKAEADISKEVEDFVEKFKKSLDK